MLLVYLVAAMVAHLALPVVRALSRAAKLLALTLDDVRATTLSLASGRIDRRMPSGERRGAKYQWHNEFHTHFHQADESADNPS
jgi:hypothetical protein